MNIQTEIQAHGIECIEIKRKQFENFEVLYIVGMNLKGEEITFKLFGDGPMPIRIESEEKK